MTFFFDGLSIQNHRKSNMDSLLLMKRRVDGKPVCIAVVCDGVGSLPDGAFASSIAIRMLGEWFLKIDSFRRLGLRMRDTVLEIDCWVSAEAREQGLRTATTLSALLLTDGGYCVVHTGDSRIYQLQDGVLTCLTEDQSMSGRLTSCLGGGTKMELYYNEGAFQKGNFLVCSDGLYKRVPPGLLRSELEQADHRNLQEITQRLARYAREQGERDNISLAIVCGEN